MSAGRAGRLGRLAVLAARRLGASRGRSALVAAIVAVSVLIFTLVQALADASTADLDEAIAEDLGTEGRYELSVPTDVGLSTTDLGRVVEDVARQSGAVALVVLAEQGTRQVACPSVDLPGEERQVLVLLAAERAEALASPNEPEGGPWCVGGVVVPDGGAADLDLRLPLLLDPPPLVLHRSLADDADAMLGAPGRLIALLQVDGDHDQTSALAARLEAALAEPAMRHGTPEGWQDRLAVSRLDTGASIREAGEAVGLVYRLLGWGVLLLGAAAVLVAQLVDGQNRRAAFGLARVVGARSSDLVALVVAEVALVVLGGVAVATGVAVAVRPALSRWSLATFDADLRLLDLGTITPLLLAVVVLVLVGGGLPAWRAARTDPLVALEP
jgi:hypothetical protein